jgi:hypothetical protein
MKRLTAFLELKPRFALASNCLDELPRFFQNWASLNGSESGGGQFPR